MGVRKLSILGYEDFMDIIWGSSQNWTSLRSHFYGFYGLFVRSMYRMGYFFLGGGLLKFQIIFRVLDIPDFFLVKSRCWVQACV